MYREELGQLVRQQRQRLGLSIRAAARQAGVDRATWASLEDGTRATRDHHWANIELTLDWPSGTIDTIMSGQHPAIERHGPELRDDGERQIWSMELVDEALRREYIRMYRERRVPPKATRDETSPDTEGTNGA